MPSIPSSGWSGELAGCEFDAKDMRAIARKHGFATTLRLTKSATRNRILGDLKRAAKKLKKNDIFFLTYSGHGGQLPNTGNDFEPDGFDETWITAGIHSFDHGLTPTYEHFDYDARWPKNSAKRTRRASRSTNYEFALTPS